MKKIMILGLGAVLTLGAAPTISAQDAGGSATAKSADSRQEHRGGPHKQGRARKGGRGHMSALRGIELTEAQKEEIRAINVRYRDEMKAKRGDVRPQGADRVRPDSAQRAQMVQINQRRQAEIREVLTSPQQQTFDRNIAQSKEKMQKRMKERGESRARKQGQ